MEAEDSLSSLKTTLLRSKSQEDENENRSHRNLRETDKQVHLRCHCLVQPPFNPIKAHKRHLIKTSGVVITRNEPVTI